MSILITLLQPFINSAFDFLGKYIDGQKRERQNVERILAKNENATLKQYIKLKDRREQIAENNRAMSLSDLIRSRMPRAADKD